jgi:hypothetical protein
MTPVQATSDYLLWPNTNPTPYACVLGELMGSRDVSSMWKGKSVKENFPADAELVMSHDFPDNTVLADSLMNREYLIVGSERLKKFFEERQVELVEYLKVAIRDHKGKIAATYYIVNPLNAVECLDLEASGARTSRVLPTHVMAVKKLVLREEAIPPDRQLFRTAGYPQGRIIRRELASAVEKGGFTGIQFQKFDLLQK